MIYEKLQNARVQLQEMKLKKSGKNNYSGFTYFELADFLPAINKIFADLKLFSKFNLTQKLATLKIIDVEDKTSEIFYMPVAELQLKGCNAIQALGGTNTYLRRYLYLNALEIVESDLFDNQAGKNKDKNEPQSQEKNEQPKTTKEIAKEFLKKLEDAGLNNMDLIKKFCDKYKISSDKPESIEFFYKNYDLTKVVKCFLEQNKEI